MSEKARDFFKFSGFIIIVLILSVAIVNIATKKEEEQGVVEEITPVITEEPVKDIINQIPNREGNGNTDFDEKQFGKVRKYDYTIVNKVIDNDSLRDYFNLKYKTEHSIVRDNELYYYTNKYIAYDNETFGQFSNLYIELTYTNTDYPIKTEIKIKTENNNQMYGRLLADMAKSIASLYNDPSLINILALGNTNEKITMNNIVYKVSCMTYQDEYDNNVICYSIEDNQYRNFNINIDNSEIGEINTKSIVAMNDWGINDLQFKEHLLKIVGYNGDYSQAYKLVNINEVVLKSDFTGKELKALLDVNNSRLEVTKKQHDNKEEFMISLNYSESDFSTIEQLLELFIGYNIEEDATITRDTENNIDTYIINNYAIARYDNSILAITVKDSEYDINFNMEHEAQEEMQEQGREEILEDKQGE